MSSTSTLPVGQTEAIVSASHAPVPVPSRSGGGHSRLDFFLSEPLRRAVPEELARCRVLICICLMVLLMDVMTLLYVPSSPQPWMHGSVGLLSLTLNGLALVLLRQRERSELSALIVCSSMAASFTLVCLTSQFPYAASHAGGMLLPALSVYLVGARWGLVLSVLMCVVVAVIHPLRDLAPHVQGTLNPAHVRLLDGSAAVCIMAIWAVSWLHASAREQLHHSRELALRTLRESEHKLKSLIDNTDDQVCSLDTEGRLILGNAAMKRSFFERSGRVPKAGEFLIPPSSPDQQDLVQRIAASIRGERVHMEDSQVRDGRLLFMDISFKPMFTADGQPVGVTLYGRDITERKDADLKLREMHRSLMDVSRQAGMAEVATGLLHNVGNTLNSVNVSANLIIERLQGSRLPGLTRAMELMRQHQGDIATFLSRDPQGQRLPSYLMALSEQLVEEQRVLLAEQRTLTEGLEHVKSIVSMQQEHARMSALAEVMSVPRLINDALRLHAVSFERSGIEIQREYADVPPILVDRHKLLQILLNLLGNARHALIDSGRPDKRLLIRIEPTADDQLRIQVVDNGKGITPEHLGRIFTQGFTTKKDGHGFGLHISALAAVEMSGKLSCQSEGPGQGATFTLELPMLREEAAA